MHFTKIRKNWNNPKIHRCNQIIINTTKVSQRKLSEEIFQKTISIVKKLETIE